MSTEIASVTQEESPATGAGPSESDENSTEITVDKPKLSMLRAHLSEDLFNVPANVDKSVKEGLIEDTDEAKGMLYLQKRLEVVEGTLYYLIAGLCGKGPYGETSSSWKEFKEEVSP